MRKQLFYLFIIISLIGLTACGANDKQITVGSKSFTEQYLFAKLATILLEDNGFKVEEKADLGSTALRKALENKQIDLTWDYTGTALVTYLGQDPVIDSQEAFDTLKEIDKENGIVWTNVNDVDNTYTIMMQADVAKEKGIQSISNLADYINRNPKELTMATNAEFANRPDGLPGLQETYGFQFPDKKVKEMEIGLTYGALRDNEIDVSVGFATDGRIEAFNFINLEDDLNFFPSYNAAVAMTEETYEKFPEIEEILSPLDDILTSEVMRKLNYQVDIEEKSVEEVARNFLIDHELIED